MTRARARSVAARAEHCCEYCAARSDYSHDPFSVEHIVPCIAGGADDLNNLCLACQGCNNYKHAHTHAVDPVTGEEVALFHPRLDAWTDHFAWSGDRTEVVGLTACGRATRDRLRLNRPELVAYRAVLCAAGLHPHPRFLSSEGSESA